MRHDGKNAHHHCRTFQSTHPSGVRPRPAATAWDDVPISIHAPQWGATSRPPPMGIFPHYFNPRTPVGCDLSANRSSLDVVGFQSTHPSGVRRRLDGTDVSGSMISIHAPQWGATNPHAVWPVQTGISIHAPQWGATSGPHRPLVECFYFNPRTPVGCDFDGSLPRISPFRFQSTHPSGVRLNNRYQTGVHESISIHAPQWGATQASPDTRACCPYFNPRTPVGCDQKPHLIWIMSAIFQSTHPSGVRP